MQRRLFNVCHRRLLHTAMTYAPKMVTSSSSCSSNNTSSSSLCFYIGQPLHCCLETQGSVLNHGKEIHKKKNKKREVMVARSKSWLLLRKFPTLPLLAPYCAIPRDYLSDTPLLRAMGFLVSQHGQLDAIPPSPFSERSPLGEHAKWRCDTPPPQKGYLSDTCAIPYQTRQNACDTPLCDSTLKRYCAIWGGGYLALGR